MSTNSRRVLVIEDEHDIARLLAMHLEDLGCAPEFWRLILIVGSPSARDKCWN